MTRKVERQNPVHKISLHPRLGEYVIEVTLKRLNNERVVVHTESNFIRAEGVFWFLMDNQDVMISLATQLIEQRQFEKFGTTA